MDRIVELAIHSASEEAVEGNVAPGTSAAIDQSGFPVMWAIAWRARAASWILRHRELLQEAIGAR